MHRRNHFSLRHLFVGQLVFAGTVGCVASFASDQFHLFAASLGALALVSLWIAVRGRRWLAAVSFCVGPALGALTGTLIVLLDDFATEEQLHVFSATTLFGLLSGTVVGWVVLVGGTVRSIAEENAT